MELGFIRTCPGSRQLCNWDKYSPALKLDSSHLQTERQMSSSCPVGGIVGSSVYQPFSYGSRDSFMLSKTIRDPEELLLMELYLSIFTILEIKTEEI